MKRLAHLVAGLTFAVPLAASAQNLTCTPTARFVCNAGGCQASQAATYVRIYPIAKAYERCDAKGCDRYPATFAAAGQFTNIDLPGMSTFAKLGPNGFFSEAASSAMITIVTYGRCQETP